ncbi:low affinity immunoglobulin epsilon Fc receptor-like [Pecten maximus]|uniref:low affinity immunoglobulin epsilon Fc receptor-like n=1 Tax=Pecten maximus TaxID=6579 RepID=UPI001458BABE|nr:low affinity immunoglobulin epsilon Fc receptor-like [Pecten maximus]
MASPRVKQWHNLALVCVFICVIGQVQGQVLTPNLREENGKARREQHILQNIREEVATMVQKVRAETVLPALASYSIQLYELTENLTRITNSFTNLSTVIEELQQHIENRSVELSCPSQSWVMHENRCYFYSTSVGSWADARGGCQSLNAMMAEATTRSINEFLKAQASLKGGSYWIGGHDISVESRWEWNTNGANIGYTDWGPDQPNDVRLGQDCLELLEKFQWQWNDRECTRVQAYICETAARYRPT